ncbi:MAG: proton-conducting transporter membrane subunit [Aggregatilineales bacterium]
MDWLNANFLPWLIPLPPFIAFAVIILVAGRSRVATQIVALGAMAITWLLSFSLVLHAFAISDLGKYSRGIFGSSLSDILGGQGWLVNGAGNGALNMGVAVDPLTAVMLFMVPLVMMMIFIYTLGYMANAQRQARFFAYLSLFAGAMLTLVVADNLLLLFVGWEVMGLCSYLLIGFWYDRSPEQEIDRVAPYQAAMKAFMTTRIADVIMLIGIAYLWATTGTLNFREIFFNEATLQSLATTPALGGFLGLSAAGLIGICIVIGTVGKSAQFPLHIWLPDAMKGPTPVSAMIHAAAMVSAGVYLIIRMFPVLSAGANIEEGLLSAPMVFMAVVGGFTAIFAASIAVAQNDIKKVLAYSTISQLGFMVAVLGVGGFAPAFFHLITHAFFKALLFLGSGSVIHGMEHGHHVAHGHHEEHGHEDSHAGHAHAEHGAELHAEHEGEAHSEAHEVFDPQDMRNMGGLIRTMPVTAVTFIIGGLALAGAPIITAGFWSKDEILLEAWHLMGKNPIGLLVLVLLSLAAILTTLYTFRQIWLTFFGEPRTEAARYAQHYNPARGEGRHEAFNAASMTIPLIVLAFFAIFAGFVGVNPSFPIVGPLLGALGIEKPLILYIKNALLEPPPLPDFNILPVLLSFAIFGVGVYAGYVLYARRAYALGQPDPVEGIIGADAYRVLVNKYYIDEFYERVFVKPAQRLAEGYSRVVDRGIIDGILHFIATAAGRIGDVVKEFNRVVIDGVGDGIPEAIGDAARSLRSVQTGRVQQYILFTLIAALIVGANLIVLAVAPNLVVPALVVQGGIAVILVLFFGAGGAQATGSGD